MKRFIMLLRHGKAIKNIKNIHGGIGSNLVLTGINEINALCNVIIDSGIKFSKILYSNRQQCYETALLLHKKLKIEINEITNLNPISLGILDGLSEDEASKKYPEYAKLMDEWRKGNIEINQLKIPGSTDCNQYYISGQNFIKNLIRNESYIIIATRSSLVLLANIMLGNNPSVGGGYKEIPWTNSGYITFEIESENYLISTLTNIL